MDRVVEYHKIARQYARDVLAGRIVACKFVRQACRRFMVDLKETKRWKFDTWHVWSVCDFIERLPHVEGRWENPNIRLEPWQIFILANVFGFRLPDGTRRFRNVYIEVGRKNAKSTLCSGIALYCLVMEGEMGPQVKVAATTGSQARIVFDVAKRMGRKVPELIEAGELSFFKDSVVCGMNGGSIQPINSKSDTQDGHNPHLVVIDELHAHKNRSLYDVMKSAFGSRKNPLLWCITTAGYNTQGVAYEQRQLVEKILGCVLAADDYFGIIYTLDEDDDPFDEEVWIKANPNLGVSIQLNEFRGYANLAKNSLPSLGEFKTKRLNLWLRGVSAWLDPAQWAARHDPALNLADFAGEECWIGADLSAKNDITAVSLMFLRGDDSVFFFRFYLPRGLVEEKAHTVGAHYAAWAEQGHLILTDGDWISREKILEDLRADIAAFNVRCVLFDQYSGAEMLAEALQGECQHVGSYAKNAKNFTAPAGEFEAQVIRGRLRHDGNPVMGWMVSNAVAERRVDKSLLPKKSSKDSANKIDGVDAALLAKAGSMTVALPGGGGSVSVLFF